MINNNIVTWSVINDEISFIDDLIKFHLTWVDAMYFLDTGSQDGTLEILKKYSAQDSRIIVEEYTTKYVSQYEVGWFDMQDPFPEITVRNFAINRTESLLKPNWMIQLDGDEVYTSNVKNILMDNEKYSCIGHSTIDPIVSLDKLPKERRGNYILHDPHVRIWKANQNFHYIENPAFPGHHYHCIPTWDGRKAHLFHHPKTLFVNEIFDFHLHWMYGKKIESFFNKINIFDKKIMIQDQELNEYSNMLPDIFWENRKKWLED
jgi:glycosyltransferase involved in cell wall biosynthesis